MDSNNNSFRIKELFHAYAPDITALSVCFHIIEAAPPEEHAELLRQTIISYDNADRSNEHLQPRFISDKEEKQLLEKHGKQVDDYFMALAGDNPGEEEFYSALWHYISADPSLPDNKSRVVALYDCCIDRRLPYCQLDRDRMLTMSDEEFNGCLSDIGINLLARLNFIINNSFSQNTQQSSLIIDMLDAMPDREHKSVLLSQLMAGMAKDIDMLRLECAKLRLYLALRD